MALILLDEKIHALDEKIQESYTLLPIKIVRFRYRKTGEEIRFLFSSERLDRTPIFRSLCTPSPFNEHGRRAKAEALRSQR